MANEIIASIASSDGDIDHPGANGIKIYPNPAKDVVYVFLEDAIKTKLQVFDINGRSVDVPITLVAAGFVIGSGLLANGTYSIVISNKEILDVKKITIVK